MIKAIVYTETENELINRKLSDPNFNRSMWESSDLNSLRGKIKKFYLAEQSYTCVYCRVKIPSSNGRLWDIEHIISRFTNSIFMFEPKNLCVSCVDCNIIKGNKKVTRSEARTRYPNNFLIVHPHFDEYHQHIKSIETGKYYVAKTLKGENTISLFRLNRFYSFADYEAEGTDLDEIQSLAGQLASASTEVQKQEILKKLAITAIENIN